ncbi:MAG: M20/M25/M40 family metallo-hydrolase [bacterium]|nr:M20/M25/M40 family metallo-hydrolase [bacterium]
MHPFANDPNVRLLTDLLQIPSPSGREERMADAIKQKITDLGAHPKQDLQGNVWTEIPGKDPNAGPVAMASHMDELAMVITAIEPDGRLRITRSGGLHPWKLGECPVDIVCDGPDTVPAHLSFGSGHTQDPNDPITQFASGAKGITWADCRLLTGLTPDQLKTAGVRVGSTAVPATAVRGPRLFGPTDDPLISAWILDNRGGTLVLLRLLERIQKENLTPARPLRLCFLVQEETGLQGAKGWAARNAVETFIAVDSSPMPKNINLSLDGRPAVWSKDTTMHFDQTLVQELAQAATRAGTELQYAVYDRAASDASGVLSTGLAPRTGTIGYPRENSHGYEVSRLSVFANLINTLYEYVVKLTGPSKE